MMVNCQKKIKKTLSDEEKQQKSLRKQIQEKLIKFATRIPIFYVFIRLSRTQFKRCDYGA